MPPKKRAVPDNAERFTSVLTLLQVLSARAKAGVSLTGPCEGDKDSRPPKYSDRYSPSDYHVPIWKLHLSSAAANQALKESPVVTLLQDSLFDARLLAGEFVRDNPRNQTDDEKRQWVGTHLLDRAGRETKLAALKQARNVARSKKARTEPALSSITLPRPSAYTLQEAMLLCRAVYLVLGRAEDNAPWDVLYPMVAVESLVALLQALKPPVSAPDRLIRSALMRLLEEQEAVVKPAMARLLLTESQQSYTVQFPPASCCGLECVDVALVDTREAMKAVKSLLKPVPEAESAEHSTWTGLLEHWKEKRARTLSCLLSTKELAKKVCEGQVAFCSQDPPAGYQRCTIDFTNEEPEEVTE